jgi:hypothetical protein
MIYYDTNQWHWIRDATAFRQVCDTLMLRACWRDDAATFRVDSRFGEDRGRFHDLATVGHYQRVWDSRGQEWQADFYADTTGPYLQRVADDRHRDRGVRPSELPPAAIVAYMCPVSRSVSGTSEVLFVPFRVSRGVDGSGAGADLPQDLHCATGVAPGRGERLPPSWRRW